MRVPSLPPMRYRSHEANVSDLFQEALLRGKVKARRWFRRALASIHPPGISERYLRRALKPDALHSPLDYFSEHASCGGFSGLRALNESATAVKQSHPDCAARMVESASRILDGGYPIFGEWIPLGRDPDWHADWTTGYRWPFAHYTRISWSDSKDKAEVKLVWELGRLNHVLTLFLAFALTTDDRYAAEALRQIEHFEESNSLEFGVNWLSPMQVSLRLINLSLMAWFLPLYPPFGNSQFLDFLGLVLAHARHVRRNLEFSHLATSNHYFSNVVALVVAARTFPHFKESEEWLAFGSRELERELGKQVYPDGFHYESSFGYHRLVTELALLGSGALASRGRTSGTEPQPGFPACRRRGGESEIPEEASTEGEARKMRNASGTDSYTERPERAVAAGRPCDVLKKMLGVIRACRTPSGELPHIGDSDDTRVLCFVPEASEMTEIDALLGIGSRLCGDPEIGSDRPPTATELFLCGPRRASSDSRLTPDAEEIIEPQLASLHASRITHHASTAGSSVFPNAGIYVQRHDDLFAVIDAGGNGIRGRGSHAHNDVLSFELSVGQTAFLADPGTYLYTGSEKWRNSFRSTAWHNTVVVDGEEQNRILPGRLFELGEDARVTILEWKSNEDEDVFDAQHDGYSRLPQPVIHRRRLALDKRGKRWRLLDRFTGKGRHELKFVFHFGLGCEPVMQPDGCVVVRGETSSLHLIPQESLAFGVTIEERWVSRRFAFKARSKAAVFTIETEVPIEVEFLLVPSTSPAMPDQPASEISQR